MLGCGWLGEGGGGGASSSGRKEVGAGGEGHSGWK